MESESRRTTTHRALQWGVLLLLGACQITPNASPEPTRTSDKPASPAPVVPPRVSAPPTTAPAASVFLARLPDSDEGAGAAASGTLRVQDGCVVLQQDSGSLFLLAVTNPRITWNDAAQGLQQGDSQFAPGTRVTIGGMQAGKRVVESLPWRAPLPPACAAKTAWITSSIDAELPAPRSK
jgi:hypothetical protein